MTETELYEFHKKMREEEKARQDIYFSKREKLTQELEALGSFPITQHPDYEQDTAYDIDDIIELLEKKGMLWKT